MTLQERLEGLVAPTIDSMGYELVRVLLQGKQRLVLQIMAERKDRKAMTVDDCADISRALSAVLDVDDPIAAAYTLEVSSPGIDRPLTRRDDYTRFSGFEAKIELSRPVNDRKRFRGRLLGLDDAGQIRLADETGEQLLPFEDIQKAKLVLTDELIAASISQQEH
jgi:ribosome maturation factor RimP